MADEPPSNVDVIAGITKGGISWTADQIKGLASAYRKREFGFIEDNETVNLIIAQRKSEEWMILENYVKDKSLRVICQMGLTLRAYEEDQTKAQNLRDKIHHVFGSDGLHIAEAVQNGILTDFIMIRVGDVRPGKELSKQIEKMLREVNKYIVFVKAEDRAEDRIMEIKTRLYSDVPEALIIYGCRGAIKRVRKIAIELEKTFGNTYQFKSNQTNIKIVIVILRPY
jgi:hypothetical protein